MQQTIDVMAVCRAGGEAQRAGAKAEAAQAFQAAVSFLRQYIAAGDAESALALEAAIYESFVKSVEDEDHYERCFSLWRDDLAALGRRYRRPPAVAPVAPGRIGFVFLNGVVLGHTEVLFRLLEFRDRAAVEPRLYSFNGCSPDFAARAQALGVGVEVFPERSRWSGPPDGFLPRLRWLQETFARNGDTTAVWLSAPVTSSFALAMGIAPVQVFWSLRYHPVRLPEIDGYVTYGSWGESERTFHGQRWTVCPVPLALERRAIARADIEKLRAQFPQRVLLGTLARYEKIASPVFLECVARILERHPGCGYLWTGQQRHAGIDAFFRERGLADRCHFVGWVDTALFGAALDLFLESFPLGCGITGYQAMAAGVPLLSFLEPNTVFGMRYWKEARPRESLDDYPVLCARSPDEYVELASRMLTDAAFRAQWIARESRFYEEEAGGSARYSARYFDTLLKSAEAKCSRS